ncbi:hypothetical protein KCU65_g166, partial [Aureobasidium melanogenum]
MEAVELFSEGLFGKIDCLTSTSVSRKAFCSSTLKLTLLAWFLGVGCWNVVVLSAPTAQRAASQRLDLFPRTDQSDVLEGQVWKAAASCKRAFLVMCRGASRSSGQESSSSAPLAFCTQRALSTSASTATTATTTTTHSSFPSSSQSLSTTIRPLPTHCACERN